MTQHHPELCSMLATLCSYEGLFGPNHPQTLHLMGEVGIALYRHGELDRARILLERSARDLSRVLGRDHEWRLRVLATLRDLLLQQRHYHNASGVQQELLECQTRQLGAAHPDTSASRDHLAAILLVAAEGGEVRTKN